ncbi:M55 family metallopeptidase [Rhodanobacter sp. UC4436_H3]
MKKIYISADIEGVACIAAPSEADPGQSTEYLPFREQMTAEVAAACEGAFAAGAREILIKDAHWTGRNIDARRLSTPDGCRLELIRGWSGHPFSMVQELDHSFAGAVFIGFHSSASSAGNPLAHTVSGRLFSRVTLNGVTMSEFHLFAMAAATVDVPVLFVSGDQAQCEEAERLVDGIVTVATLRGIGPSVQSLMPSEAVRRVREAVEVAVNQAPLPCVALPAEFAFTLEFSRPAEAYARSFYPGVKQVSARELLLETTRYLDVLTFLKFASSYR